MVNKVCVNQCGITCGAKDATTIMKVFQCYQHYETVGGVEFQV